MSSSMAFLHHYSLDRTRQNGQWVSDYSFVHHYLDHTLEEAPCVSMAGPPPLLPDSPGSNGDGGDQLVMDLPMVSPYSFHGGP